jgi:hypothetical protein
VSFKSSFEGANNGVNNVFDDGSASNHTITANGNVTQGSFGPFARPDGEWGVSFDGDRPIGSAANYLDTPTGADFELDANYTIEGWFFQTVREDGNALFELNDYRNGILFRLGTADSNYDNWYINGTDYDSPVSSFPLNQWNHFAITRDGSTNRLFANGVQIATASVSGDINSPQGKLRIGGLQHTTGQQFVGVVSNFRLIKGTALYTSNFTPSTSKLTAVTNTKLLTCQSNRFVDNSASAHTLTPYGNTAVTAFGPILTSSVYDAAVNGASVYLDGSGDYVHTPESAYSNTGSFTVEAWVYTTVTDTGTERRQHIIAQQKDNDASRSNFNLHIVYATQIVFVVFSAAGDASADVSSNTGLSPNTWTHIAGSFDGSNLRLFVNGVLKDTTASTNAPRDTTQPVAVGARTTNDAGTAGTEFFQGYISDARLTKSAVYTSAFTPPTATLTAITNTSLLLNMADGQAIDSAAQNNLTLYGNAKLSTGQAKFGDTSMVFDETGDYVTLPTDSFKPFGTGNFTIECFARFATSTVGNGQGLFQLSSGYLNSAVRGPAAGANNEDGKWSIYHGTTFLGHGSLVPSQNTWYHVAYVRNSGVTKLYIDGTEILSVSDTTNYTDKYFVVGGWYSTSYLLNGYIDEFRISHMARYTSNFTAPSEPFADKGQ